MFGQSDLRKTTFYQEVKEEIQEELKRKIRRKVEKRFRQEVIPRLLALGLTPEKIAYALDLDLKVVNMTVLKNYMVIS